MAASEGMLAARMRMTETPDPLDVMVFTPWDNPSASPLADIQLMMEKARFDSRLYEQRWDSEQ